MKRKWFAYCTENEAPELKLLLFPYAGGGAAMFVQWKKFIDKKADVYPVLYPFREARRSEKLPDSLTALAESIAAENEDIFKGRYAMFGHCAGSTIAYETAKAAKKLYGTEPEFFIASGAEPPGFTLDDMKYLENSSNEEFLEYLIKSGFADESVRENKGFIQYYLPIIAADFRLLFSYKPSDSGKLNCPIHIFRGNDDNVIDPSRLPVWTDYTSAETDEKVFEGGHYYFNSSPENVCAGINDIINKEGK